MDRLESSPPFRVVAPIILALLLGSAHLLAPLVQRGESLALPRLAVATTLLLVLVVSLFWAATARVYVLMDEAIQVHRAIAPWAREEHSLSELVRVGIVGQGPLGLTVVEAGFRSGSSLSIPLYYANSREVFRRLFSKLGANFASKSTEA